MKSPASSFVLSIVSLIAGWASAGEVDEFKIRRQEVFEFSTKPTVHRDGDKVTIAFTAKGYCDATVAIEEATGRIVRHLASGVLGPNAPEPFQKDSLKQAIIWDGKDDQGRHVEDTKNTVVRVSLGLKPQFERTLFWHPMKRCSDYGLDAPIFSAAPEGMYVYDGGLSFDHVRLFDHDGNYVRTVYPFPAKQVEKVEGLFWHTAQQDGKRFPVKPNGQQSTLLTSGSNAWTVRYKDGKYSGAGEGGTMAHYGQGGRAASAMAVRDGRVALAFLRLNRFSTDGAVGAPPIYGPLVCFEKAKGFIGAYGLAPGMIGDLVRSGRFLFEFLAPLRIALSPDGKWVYLTRYEKTVFGPCSVSSSCWFHVVMRMPLDGSEPPQVFAGETVSAGSDERHFNMPAGIDCDQQGQVYVADHGNNRVQVFSPDGKLVRSIKVEQPVDVCIHRKTGELYVFCWPLLPPKGALGGYAGMLSKPRSEGKSPCNLLKFSNEASPRLLAQYELPLGAAGDGSGTDEGLRATLDSWSNPLSIWLTPGVLKQSGAKSTQWLPTGILLLKEKDGKLEIARDFDKEVAKAILKVQPPACFRQRLYVHPLTGKLYVGEEVWACAGTEGWTFKTLLEVDPESGNIRELPLPLEAEDAAFGPDGCLYLWDYRAVVRYEWDSMREVPFDYGEQTPKIISGVMLPANPTWHHGGMGVSVKGNIAVGCRYTVPGESRTDTKFAGEPGRKYSPTLYPGRNTMYNYGAIYVHVWDKHGKLIHEDTVPGLGGAHGVGIDKDDNVYVLAAGRRIQNGVPYYNDFSGTLIKVKPGQAKILTDGQLPVPLSADAQPSRPPDMDRTHGRAWVEGADWMFGGIGWDGKKGIGCACWNSRFALDYFGRSFGPEADRYSVAVLDTNGNLILRVGQYGNVDDGKPLVAAGGPPNPRPIGGDEVSLFTAWYVGTQTDRRLFIADAGNHRLLSVRLGYHTEEKIAMKDVLDDEKK